MGWNTYYDVLQLRERKRSEGSGNRWQRRVAISTLRKERPILLKNIHDVFESDFSRAEEARASMHPDSSEVNDMPSSSSPVVVQEDGATWEISRDDTFYCPDYVIFLAEKTLFRIPPLRLTTPHFTALFSLPDGGTSQVEGRTDDDPIRLPSQISARAFRAFMNMLYPELKQSNMELETADLILALELATMWEFDHIRDQAITELGPEPLAPLEQLLLGRRLRVAKWIRNAYERLCTQKELTPKGRGREDWVACVWTGCQAS
ncbi:uncharacterized protein STEHIDRAFT_118117 [Stereum hirsutum FP-91666 SS1]|uniref:uncharacterized protein n=1 Tax=Stereum hirsutum (strain FP-91666) TaxID=721885 RepID=UPI000440DCEF|nr:uncharacterized protein STEHIDRAFT_118117 [Stereum hirsutum FP-91666 SS1]EIM90897.1 hypothetical protein STEHIDRAFT_118117 [Stereum hirsutum FP-91666 SS1]